VCRWKRERRPRVVPVSQRVGVQTFAFFSPFFLGNIFVARRDRPAASSHPQPQPAAPPKKNNRRLCTSFYHHSAGTATGGTTPPHATRSRQHAHIRVCFFHHPVPVCACSVSVRGSAKKIVPISWDRQKRLIRHRHVPVFSRRGRGRGRGVKGEGAAVCRCAPWAPSRAGGSPPPPADGR
jgi:hypothetical protein